jgi:hypothetical protein
MNRKIKLLYFNAMLPKIGDQSITELAKQAHMSKEDKDTERMGIQYNSEKLKVLLTRLDKNIWIPEFWYSMSEYCGDFPFEKNGHPDVEGSNHWAELVKKYL